jgi:hypothetical protein
VIRLRATVACLLALAAAACSGSAAAPPSPNDSKLIEDLFLGGERLDPATLQRPDSRPTVREDVEILGDLRRSFDFRQEPLPPLILDPHPEPGPASTPGG